MTKLPPSEGAADAVEAHRRYEAALSELGEASRALASLLAGRPLSTLEAVAAMRRRERRAT